MENCPALPGQNLFSTSNRRVRSVPAGRGEISSRQTGTCNHHPSFFYQKALVNFHVFDGTFLKEQDA